MLAAYARFIVRHSYLFLFGISVACTILTIIPLAGRNIPSFSDPIIGFETRGTILSHRFIAWENLIDETRPSRRLAVNPKEIEDQIRMNITYHNRIRDDKIRTSQKQPKKHRNKKKLTNLAVAKTVFTTSIVNTSTEHVHWGFGKNVSYEDENTVFRRNHTRKQWKSLRDMQQTSDNFILHNDASNVCGAPAVDHAHLIVTSTNSKSMLSFENVMELCHLQSYLINIGDTSYLKLCQRSHLEDVCCPIWSLPNYIALIAGKSSCRNVSSDDVKTTVQVLKKCAGYFHNFTLMASCELNTCRVPTFCSQYNAVYNLLFYILDSDGFSPTNMSNIYVKNVMTFLPLPRSSTVLPYYLKLQSSNLSYESLIIPAMDFGLKNTLFDIWIIDDTWLIGLGSVFVFVLVFVYTKSLLLTLLLFIAITYSLGVAYFLYIYVLNLDFFPFMNLLVIVVVIGIGADDAFLYVKIWKMISRRLIKDNIVNDNSIADVKDISSAGETILIQIIEETIKHTVIAIFVTTLTTAVAFFASYISYIPAINCFSIFAGTAVLVNFFLMVTWLPVSVFILDVKLITSNWIAYKYMCNPLNDVGKSIKALIKKYIVSCIMRSHVCVVLILGAFGVSSIVIVFYYPGLQLPDSKEFQLFQSNHPFELYDSKFKDKFLFERWGRDVGLGFNMPLRWIWGVKAIDNGNHMDPSSRGKLVFDKDFSISDPNSQLWLLDFCAKIKTQSFYQHTLGPLLPNCFIESFKVFMSRKCMDNIAKIDRSPCCESSHFPYKREIFDFCIIKAMESLYLTPRELFVPGVAGPKFLRSKNPPTVAAIVVEFESTIPFSMSYTKMNDFFNLVENWTNIQLENAPAGMKSGWFLSDLQFYDLQRTLASGTVMALLLSAVLGFIVLVPSTLSIVLSICSLLAITFSSTVTIAILVICGWKLNVLESVAISTSAGLAVDFSLHYAISYVNASGRTSKRVKYALSASSGPTAAAALTSASAGIFLLRSKLLPYSQIGIFLALIMTVSWIYATFFLCGMLYMFGPDSSKPPTKTVAEERKPVSRVSSVCSAVPNLESHELEHLADSNCTNIIHPNSPSSMSAVTVVLHEDVDITLNKNELNSFVLDND